MWQRGVWGRWRCQTGGVSEVFGGARGRRDPELARAAQRRREAFARDIGDERGRAFAYQPPGRRRRPWSGIIGIGLLVFAGLGAIPLLRGSDGGLVPRQCERPAVGTAGETVPPGGRTAWQVAGPDSEYVVALDGGRVTVDAAGAVDVTSGRLLAGPFRLSGCRSAQTLFDAPGESGSHEVTLFRRTGGSGYARVASAELTVGRAPAG